MAANAFGLALGAAALGLVGEITLRATTPFMSGARPEVFRPGVGFTLQPLAEVRATNGLDYWTTDRVNSLGFRDREPPSPQRAAAGCHLTVIGDSFVEAKQVPLADRVHLRLEELAREELPGLGLTTSAFGLGDTGQVQQLAFYDEWVQPLRPKVLVLVLVPNDLRDNSALFRAAQRGWDPERAPEPSVVRGPDGAFVLRPPAAKYADGAPRLRPSSVLRRWTGRSHFARWLRAKIWVLSRGSSPNAVFASRLESLRRRPQYAELLGGYRPRNRYQVVRGLARPEVAPVLEDALDSTAFALGEFRRRADGIGAALIGLATHSFDVVQANADRERAASGRNPPPSGILLERMRSAAAASGIPVLDLGAEIRRRGGTVRDVRFPHDNHWNAAGHRLAAEMLLRWLAENREVCDGPRRGPEEQPTGTAAAVSRPGAPERLPAPAGDGR